MDEQEHEQICDILSTDRHTDTQINEPVYRVASQLKTGHSLVFDTIRQLKKKKTIWQLSINQVPDLQDTYGHKIHYKVIICPIHKDEQFWLVN